MGGCHVVISQYLCMPNSLLITHIYFIAMHPWIIARYSHGGRMVETEGIVPKFTHGVCRCTNLLPNVDERSAGHGHEGIAGF